jgi:hypothetical protein
MIYRLAPTYVEPEAKFVDGMRDEPSRFPSCHLVHAVLSHHFFPDSTPVHP